MEDQGHVGLWIDNIVAWTYQSSANLLRIARDRGCWSALIHTRSQPSQSDDAEVTQHDFQWRVLFKWMFTSAAEKHKNRAELQTADILNVHVVALAPQEELVSFISLLVCTLRRTLTSISQCSVQGDS